MSKEQKDVDPSLGPIGILREAVKILRTHAKVFVRIQVTLMLGLAIMSVVADYFIFRMFLDPSPRGLEIAVFRHRLPISIGFSRHAITLWLSSIVYGIVLQAAVCLSQSATLYSVGLHYAGQAVSFLDVIHASIPNLWMRLAVTTTCNYLMANAIALVRMVGRVLLLQDGAGQAWMLLWCMFSTGLLLVFGLALSVIFAVASGVSVLDEDYYGWAAMAKALKLLKGKLVVAIPFQILLLVPASVVSVLAYAVYCEFSAFLVPTVVLLVTSTTFFWQFTAVCSGVQYASFKAYHNETITESLHQKRATEGYERLVDGTTEALVGGQQVGSEV